MPKDLSKVMLKRKRELVDAPSDTLRVCFNDIVDVFIYSKPTSEMVSLN